MFNCTKRSKPQHTRTTMKELLDKAAEETSRKVLREVYGKFDIATLASMKTVALSLGDKLAVEVIDEVIKVIKEK